MAIQDDDSRKASTGMMSLMKLLNAYEEGFDTDHVNQASLAPLEDQIATTAENTTSGKYIWDIDSTEASSHPDVPKTGIEDIREMIRALQYELKAKSTQITELKTILARKRLSKESNVSKLREDWDKKIDSLGREFGKVSVQFLCNNPIIIWLTNGRCDHCAFILALEKANATTPHSTKSRIHFRF